MTGSPSHGRAPTVRVDAPWIVPVPVRPSSFVPLYPEHAPLAVEVDLGRIGAYSGSARPDEEHLLCDLQDNPDFTSHGRLGSGRAGVYRGKYLKGIGRTLLAGNWANEGDLLHHTGHLRTSNAIRELTISTWLEAKNCGSVINPCEGILVRPLAPELRGHIEASLKDAPDFRPDRPNRFLGDWKLQAISVKKAGCVRFSNLVWLSHHLDFFRAASPMTTSFRQFLGHYGRALAPESAPGSLTPDDIAALFFRSVDRSIDTLRTFWRFGLSWGSLHNNFAVDGRYVDLEWPVLLGKPLVGLIGMERHDELALPHRHMLWGLFEVLAFVMHHRMLAWHLRGRFRAIARTGHPVQPRERQYARAVADAFTRQRGEHLLFSRRKLRAMLVGWVAAEVDLSPVQRRALGKAIDTVYAAHFLGRPGRLALTPALADLPRVGFLAQGYPHQLPGFGGDGRVTSDEAEFLHRVWFDLDRIGDADVLLGRLGEAVEKIRTYCAVEPRAPAAGVPGDCPLQRASVPGAGHRARPPTRDHAETLLDSRLQSVV